jgi:TolB protein
VGGSTGPIDLAGSSGNGPSGMAEALKFDPPAFTLVIDGATAAKTASYSLIGTFAGQDSPVTAESLQFDRPDLASAKNGSPVVLTATGAVAGKGTLHAVYGGREATAELDVQLVEKHVEGAIPDDVLQALDAGGAQDPKLSALLYPYDKTVFALGLQSPAFMWTAVDAVTDVYRLHVEQSGYEYDLYSFAEAPGRLTIPQDTWDRVTSSNTGDAMAVTLYRYDATAKAAYSSAKVNLTIAPESLRGAIYYWTTSAQNVGQGNITRIYPGVGSMPETVVKGKCVGCHSVSADGTTLVVDVEDKVTAPSVAPYEGYGKTRAWASYELPAASTGTQTKMYGADPALTPDGKYVVFGNASNPVQPGSKLISLAETKTAKVIATSGLDDVVLSQPSGLSLMMPSFSLDGKKLVAVEGSGNLFENVIPVATRIVSLDFDASVPKFDPTLHEVVNINQFAAGNQAFGYPAFTPDNQFVAYHTGKYSTGCNPDGCDDTTPDSGEIWISPAGGGMPIRLTALNDPPAVKDHNAGREPMFCPVKRGGYSWMIFTSMRDWGNALTGANTNAKRRLWVAAIDGDIQSSDPSHPAFYLEGQADTANMRAFWALAQCIQTPPPGETGTMCKNNFECCSGFCVEGVCVDKTTESCVGIGGACKVAAECCNSGVVACVDEQCTIKPPK